MPTPLFHLIARRLPNSPGLIATILGSPMVLLRPPPRERAPPRNPHDRGAKREAHRQASSTSMALGPRGRGRGRGPAPSPYYPAFDTDLGVRNGLTPVPFPLATGGGPGPLRASLDAAAEKVERGGGGDGGPSRRLQPGGPASRDDGALSRSQTHPRTPEVRPCLHSCRRGALQVLAWCVSGYQQRSTNSVRPPPPPNSGWSAILFCGL